MILRVARAEEAEKAFQCIEDAKAYQQFLGFAQWHAAYPTLPIIQEDIQAGIGYVFADDEEICGYCCIIVGDEPAYHAIEGAWKTDRPYAVVHRMAFSRQNAGRGLSVQAFALIKDFCAEIGIDAIRIDTHEDNKVMRHILAREGFEYCGIIIYDGPKFAYEWDR